MEMILPLIFEPGVSPLELFSIFFSSFSHNHGLVKNDPSNERKLSYPIGSMGLVYLPTFTNKNQPNVGKYTSPMDPMGIGDSHPFSMIFGRIRVILFETNPIGWIHGTDIFTYRSMNG